jgi:hypothetical protein
MHRILVSLQTRSEWYSVVREANVWFGAGNWRGQRRVKRQLRESINPMWPVEPKKVWFEVPDLKFASWITVKYTLPVEIIKGTDSEIAE